MTFRTQLVDLIRERDGLVLTSEVEGAGIPRHYLTSLAREGVIERAGHGIYVTPDAFEDELYVLQIKSPQLIFSHETALYLHDLIDRDPISLSVTVPTGYHNPLLKEKGLRVHTVKKDWHRLGLTKSSTVYGRTIHVYNPERTLCDMFRQRNNIDPDLLNESMKRYMTRKERNVPQLLRYAETFRVSSPLRKYVEILL